MAKKFEKILDSKYITITMIIIIIFATLVLPYIIYDFTPLIKVPLGNSKLGYEKCDYFGTEMEIGFWEETTIWKCNLCWRISETTSGTSRKLCGLCSNLTDRCSKCGKLFSKAEVINGIYKRID